MDRRAANEQQQDAQLRVFYMLVFMALLIVRAGLEARPSRGQFTFFPGKAALPPGRALTEKSKLPPAPAPSSPPPAHLYPAALRLLRAAEAALRLLTAMTREVYELMKQTRAVARPARCRKVAGQCERPRKRLDSS